MPIAEMPVTAPPRAVVILPGLSGRFFESTCPSSCTDSVLDWEVGGVHYQVRAKAGDLAQLRALAVGAMRRHVP